MEVVLLQRIGSLGQMGDVVKVRNGYARNYLLPQKKALRANKENLTLFETQRAQLEAQNLDLKKDADAVAEKLTGQSFVVIRQAGDTGQLYGSVSPRDIAEAATENGFTVDRRQIVLERPIKTLGVHDTSVQLHPEVIVKVHVNVARSGEEAERQARGEDVLVVEDEQIVLETFNPDEAFEDGAGPAEDVDEAADAGEETATDEQA